MHARNPLSFLVLTLLVLTLGGCGDDNDGGDLPPGVAARVGGDVITQKAVDQAVIGQVAVKHSAENMPPYWATDIQGCIKAQGERGDATPAQVKRRCEQQRERAREAALRLLIQGRWYRREAKRRRIAIPTVRAGALNASEHAGVKPDEIVGVIEANTARALVGPKEATAPPRFSRGQVTSYYQTHRERYVTHAQKLIEAVLTPTRAQAESMAARLRGGEHAKPLARRFKGDGVTLPFRDGLLSTLAAERLVQEAAKRVDRGEVGMVKMPRGWYVFKVAVDLPTEQKSLREARADVEQDLQLRRTGEILEIFNTQLHTRYGAETTCADGYEVPECKR